MRAAELFSGDRRMEAENYLSSGHGLRLAIKSNASGWRNLSEIARSWQPNRLKGIQVSREFGTPFLAATQVYDVRPVPRKWLSLDRTEDAKNRFVTPGTILVTRSGSVGRPTLTYDAHIDTIISDDLLRIEPYERRDRGWIYGFLLTSQSRAMTKGAQYGHIIKHLEPSHLDELPIPTIDDETANRFNQRAAEILALRNESYRLTLLAERCFEEAIGPIQISDWGESGFEVRMATLSTSGRTRLDASVSNPGAMAIHHHLSRHGLGSTRFSEAGYDIWVPGRYKRVPAEDGVIYRDSADLLEVSPDLAKRFADCAFGDRFRGRVRSGWILIPCSGQVYGIIGTATLATSALEGQVVSNHVLRAAPRPGAVRAGYVVTALSHPVLGRPLIKALAFGSSVPELNPDDVAAGEIVRLTPQKEAEIADAAEASAQARASADLLENEIRLEAETIVSRFISGA